MPLCQLWSVWPGVFPEREKCIGGACAVGDMGRLDRLWLVVPLALISTFGASVPATGGANPSALCERAALIAASQTAVPISVLKAIMLTETGRVQGDDYYPWPWTVNMEGKGTWFDSRSAATAYAEEHHRRGATSFDVGCFQINFKWHNQNFASLESMFDPLENALYAAGFLAGLFEETGDWGAAAGAYHSRTAIHADAYRATFLSFREALLAEDDIPLPEIESTKLDWKADGGWDVAERTNDFPLLRPGAQRGLGSLVPKSETGLARSLFAPDEAG